MKNYYQRGELLTLPAPGGGVTSGEVVFVGDLHGVAVNDASEGQDFVMQTRGVFLLPKVRGEISTGQKVHWKTDSKAVTAEPTGNRLIGAVTLGARDDDETAFVRLNDAL